MTTARIGIVTVSDRASRGEYEDLGGPAIAGYLNEVLTSPWTPEARVISDDQELIETTLRELCDEKKCCLVVTTGGRRLAHFRTFGPTNCRLFWPRHAARCL